MMVPVCKRKFYLRMICLALPALLSALAHAAPMRFIHNAPESESDHRYDYHWRVLRAALDATRDTWGDFQITPAIVMNESRQLIEMKNRSADINTMVLDSSTDMEANLVPVRVPIDRGLLGYRVFLIRKADQTKFAAVETLDQLRAFSIGQGSDWSDVKVYAAAGFNVVGGPVYEGLFAMLDARRFDAFGRGVTEVLGEYTERRSRFPNMSIESDLLVYYPMPVYFWFQKNDEGRRMAARVDAGMRKLVANGTLNKLFRQEFEPVIKQLKVRERRLFRLENPLLPPNQPFDDQRLWFDPRENSATDKGKR